MPDVFSIEKRSAVMAAIRSKGNRDTELRMIKLFRYHRICGWRRNRALFGRPDFAFPKQRVVVFVDGCFWHGCPKQRHARLPNTRVEYWAPKLRRNKARDLLVTKTLRNSGWIVLRFWECDLHPRNWSKIARRIRKALASASNAPETQQLMNRTMHPD